MAHTLTLPEVSFGFPLNVLTVTNLSLILFFSGLFETVFIFGVN